MQFLFLTFTEVEGAAIKWEADAAKDSALIAAALNAGFTRGEVDESPVGVLEEDFRLPGIVFRSGARALIGMNGSTLLEIPQ